MHELAHIYLHHNKNIDYFFDDLETTDNENVLEMEADEFARDILIPPKDWANCNILNQKTTSYIDNLSAQLKIHPAIVAGRVRYESKNYRILNKIIRKNNIRYLFSL
jgi:HTH-type transcriptional regulator/antitoxin HigA